jgi:hypothetical protein
MNMRAKITLVAAIAVLAFAAPARADSVDGKPMHPDDRYVPASVRGSPSILFEDVGALGPLDCRTASCGAQGRF